MSRPLVMSFRPDAVQLCLSGVKRRTRRLYLPGSMTYKEDAQVVFGEMHNEFMARESKLIAAEVDRDIVGCGHPGCRTMTHQVNDDFCPDCRAEMARRERKGEASGRAGQGREEAAMIMSQGEKMVWAAAFVDELKTSSAASEGDKSLRRLLAVTRGRMAVDQARIALRELEKATKDDHETIQMRRAMLGDEG